MIEEIQAQLMQITGAIFGGERFTKSGNAVIDNGADKRGFKLGADGKLIASNGEFSGLLNVKSIRIDGNVAAGDNYLLKAANYMVKVAPIDTGWIDTSVPQIAKQLLTMARGTANVRLVFPATKGFTSGTINAGDYKIYVNGAVAAAGSVLNDSMTDNVEKTHAVNLNGDSNQVWLELFPGGGGNYTGKFPIYNTVFELRIAQDPGLLAAL
jgi:hypothetical protein